MTTQQPLITKNQATLLGVSLFSMGLGQALLGMGREFIDAQQPIDWAHWLLLVGAVGIAISVARMRTGTLGRIARALIVTGAVAFVGMSAIDLLLWTLPAGTVIDDAIDNALSTPGLAIPFLWVGPSLLFIGLAAKAIEWRNLSTWGAVVLLSGTLVSGYGQGIGERWVVVASFVMILVGLTGICLGQKSVKK